ncbi:hypothetical protein BARBAKC583_0118 [Bartonella bacilliformis KC583]|uniref:Uncharacterized protein n=1 Tax=Bartonella bacilliformis (strain ATCC 35685 / KC583 / Herrer 020/F12,63) TaxID=360095 RepID=A1UR53_BARBK|nr:hypothetical protein BARBAKC583_0118 [Bartonella bacilliformis KC583]
MTHSLFMTFMQQPKLGTREATHLFYTLDARKPKLRMHRTLKQ